MQAKAQLACSPPVSSHHWPADHGSITALLRQDTVCSAMTKPGGPLDDCFMPELMALGFRDDVVAAQHCAAKADAGDLQYLAQAMMMRSPNYSL